MIVDDTDDDDRVLYSGVLLKKRKVFWKEADCVLRKVSLLLVGMRAADCADGGRRKALRIVIARWGK